MATPGMIPTFVTGANARIRVDGVTFAYAQDVSYAISVDVVPIETMGRYEAVAQEPVNYSVGGDLAIVRYTKAAITRATSVPNGAASGGNGMGNVNGNTGVNMSTQFNPQKLLESCTWDLEVFQKGMVSDTISQDSPSIIKIRDCRFTSLSGGLNKRGILVNRMRFVGILAQDDSFESGHSGDTDLSAT